MSARLDVGAGESGLFQRGGRGGLNLDLWLEGNPDGVRAKGTVTGSVCMECTRCLEPCRQHLDIEVDEFYRRPGMGALSADGRLLKAGGDVQEEDAYVIEEGVIDLNLLLNDAVMLSLPIKRLCREDCRGLCQVCGRNLNEGECGCVVEDIDPRLEVLRTLLDREEG